MTRIELKIEKCIKEDLYKVHIVHDNGLVSKELLEFNPYVLPTKKLKKGDIIVANYCSKPDRLRCTSWYLKERA